MRLSRQQIEATYHQGLDAVMALVEGLQDQIDHLQLYVAALEKRLSDVEARLGQNSSNSSRPPSSDVVRKKPPVRTSTGKPKGGQPGHEGHRLEMVETPEVVVEHAPGHCRCCGVDLSQAQASAQVCRQVFELPPITLEVTEHRVIEKRCAFCSTRTWGRFPAEVQAPVQYGPRLKALVLYLNTYQLVPYERLSQVIEDLTGQAISTGTLSEIVRQGPRAWQRAVTRSSRIWPRAPSCMPTRPGCTSQASSTVVHVASTAEQTLYGVTSKRGKAGMDALGVLPDVTGTRVARRALGLSAIRFVQARALQRASFEGTQGARGTGDRVGQADGQAAS